MTGESKIVHKDSTRSPFLKSGCKVADGYGSMLVTAVGINTEWGLLMVSISEDNGEEIPLQVRLNGVATFIGIVGFVVAVAVLIILAVRFFTGHSRNPDGSVQFVAGRTSVSRAIDGFIRIFTAAVTIVVVAVPEGLPLDFRIINIFWSNNPRPYTRICFIYRELLRSCKIRYKRNCSIPAQVIKTLEGN